MPQGPAPGPTEVPPADGAVPCGAKCLRQQRFWADRSVAVTQYDPRTGRYVTPDGQVQQLANAGAGTEPKSWKELLPI